MAIELTPQEIDRYMLAAPRLILCVGRPGKAPLPLPMWFGWIDGKIYMHTVQASRKVQPIRENPQVACLVESGEEYFSLKAVLIVGHCDVIDDQAEVKKFADLITETKPIYRKYRPEKWPPHLERLYAQPRSLLRVTPKSITSWDFQKIRR